MLQDEEAIGNLFIFFIAGHESSYFQFLLNTHDSAITLSYALTMLALNPEVQETLRLEIEQICKERAPAYSDLPQLVYAHWVMFETLRMFPIATALPKIPASDQLLYGKYLIQAKTTVFIDLVNLHYNPNYWGSDVHSFNPSRFDPKNSEETKSPSSEGVRQTWCEVKIPVPGTFCSFSDGARVCLGKSINEFYFNAKGSDLHKLRP